jgi:hypothetical protein
LGVGFGVYGERVLVLCFRMYAKSITLNPKLHTGSLLGVEGLGARVKGLQCGFWFRVSVYGFPV